MQMLAMKMIATWISLLLVPALVRAQGGTVESTGEPAVQALAPPAPAPYAPAAPAASRPAQQRPAATDEPAVLAPAPPALRYQPWVGPSDPQELRDGPERGPRPYDQRDELLFAGGASHGGFGGPQLKVSRILSAPSLFVGAGGGWLVNHALVIGLAGYGLATRHDVPTATRVDGEPSVLGFGYGGLSAGYLLWPHRLLHAGVGALLGAGGLVAVSRRSFDTSDRWNDEGREHHTAHGDAVFVMEPHVEVELNVVRFMRIAIGASYRYVAAVDAPGLTSQKLSAPAGGLTFKFGRF
jgi:hypothetical protein